MNMQANTKNIILKIISCVLLAASIAMLFAKWITYKPETYSQRREINGSLFEAEGELHDIDRFIWENDMEYWNYSDARKVYKALKGFYRIIKDLSLSPYEAVPLTVDISTIVRLAKKYGLYMDEQAETVYHAIKWVGLIVAVLAVSTAVLGLLALILHLCNRPGCGWYVMILDILLLSSYIAIVIATHVIADDKGIEGLDRIYPTAWPFIAAACSVASCVCWKLAVKGRKYQIPAYINYQNYGAQPAYGMPMNNAGMGAQPAYGMPMNNAGMGAQPGYGMPMNNAGMGAQPGYGMPVNNAGMGAQPGYGAPMNNAGMGMQPGYGMPGDYTGMGTQPVYGAPGDYAGAGNLYEQSERQ